MYVFMGLIFLGLIFLDSWVLQKEEVEDEENIILGLCSWVLGLCSCVLGGMKEII